MKREILTAEERAEYDELVYAAGYDEYGQRRPSHEIGPMFAVLLADARKAGRRWATWVKDDDQAAGHLARFKRWDRQRAVVETNVGGAVVSKSAVMAVRRRQSADDGRSYWQGVLWIDMTGDELKQVIAGSSKRVASEKATQQTARRLLGVLHRTGAETVREGLTSLNVTLDQFLSREETADAS